MKALDVGCGVDPERWLPGADLCERNSDDMKCFNELREAPSNEYELVWYRYGFRLEGPQDETIEQLWRVTKDKATIVFTDYMSFINWDNGEEPEVPFDEYLDWLKKKFHQWNFDHVSVGWEENTITVIMTRGWG